MAPTLAFRPMPFVLAQGTGLEWMTIAALVIPALLLLVLIWLGQRNTV